MQRPRPQPRSAVPSPRGRLRTRPRHHLVNLLLCGATKGISSHQGPGSHQVSHPLTAYDMPFKYRTSTRPVTLQRRRFRASVQFSSPSYSAEAFKTAPLHPHAPARVHPPAYAPATYGGFSVPHLMSPPPVHPAMYPPHLAGHVLGEDPYASMVRLAFRPVRRKPPSRPTTVLPGRWIARGTAESPGEHAHHHHRL